MKFRNETSENIKYRVGTRKNGYDWHNARPGKVVDIPQMLGEDLHLTKVEEDVTLRVEPSIDMEAIKRYKKRLEDIDGIGKKTAEDIMDSYPTETDLKIGIAHNDEIHKRDDVDEKVKEEFK